MRAVAKATEYRRTSRSRFWVAASAAAIAAIVTAYLGTMTLLWGLHVRELRSVASDLARTDADRRSTLSAQESDLATAETARGDALADIRALAHTKALSQDQRYVYHDFALVLKDCADERAEVVTVVQQRYLYVTWTVHRYDNNVAEYCAQIKQAWAEALTKEGS
jgi:uncharacterized membrane protein YccC